MTVTVAPGVAARFSPVCDVANTAGIVRPVASPIIPTSPVRPGCPSFMTTTAAAPAFCALRTLTANPHVPRCTSAIPPCGKPAKSSTSQPLVLLLSGSPAAGTTTPTGVSGPVAVPSGDPVSKLFRVKSASSAKVTGSGLTRMSSLFSSK